ncbi:glycosyltransferase family 2 protein [Sphingobacterium kitahiroshimense]|uniref:glycosyltransferase family 2 protein n=1 Tax=Sphingobacterium kitahiroshimense TaxID=470446 RepID=UPI00320B1543
MNNVKVSVVIPMYNAAETIIGVLNSVYSQTWKKNLEIIIVNDGSTDNSKQLVESYILQHDEIQIELLHQDNSGVSRARNEGMRRCTGDWICLLDSDDIWLPNKLERQLQVLFENPKIDFLGTTRNDERFDRIGFRSLDNLSRISAKDLLFKFVFVTPTVIFRRLILEDIGYFDETQRYAEEGNYFIRIADKYTCYLLNESLVITGGRKHHFGESGLSSNLWAMEKGELKNIRLAYSMDIIDVAKYGLFSLFSILKYIRRVWIVKVRSKKH